MPGKLLQAHEQIEGKTPAPLFRITAAHHQDDPAQASRNSSKKEVCHPFPEPFWVCL